MYEKVLVAVDHSEHTKKVLDAARGLAALANGEVHVLHVREREVIPRMGLVATESDDAARQDVEAAVLELNAAGVTATGEVADALYGRAAGAIVEEAQRSGAGVIVMGSRGHGDLAGLVLGSTTHKVIHLSDRPVLVVR